jgi:peptidoglycan-N-acetylglucosamine deacetylase
MTGLRRFATSDGPAARFPGPARARCDTPAVDRRAFLALLAAGTAGTLAGCAEPLGLTRSAAARQQRRPGDPAASAGAENAAAPPVVEVITSGGPTIVDRLPDEKTSRRFALTVDDGVSTEVLSTYVDFVIAARIRMTFFVNGVYDSWTVVRPKLAPLVESGQVQLGNHTWNHPSIKKLTAAKITDQLETNEAFLRRTYGVSGRPYFRPPYGDHDARTDAVTGDLGFDRTVLWYGSLGDSTIVTPAELVVAARQWFTPGRIVIGHANHDAVTHVYPQLLELIRSRTLQTVTLRDVFGDKPMTEGR